MLDPTTYLESIRRDAELVALAAERDLTPDVPACPGWTVADLIEHLGVVHRHKTQIVAERWMSGAPDPIRPPALLRIVPWFREGARELVATLATHDPTEPVSTWEARNETVGFWYRRMAHETLVHRIDAEQAHGDRSPVDPALAADGIDEILFSFLSGAPDWAQITTRRHDVHLAPDDGETTWTARLAAISGTSPETGKTYHDLPLVVLDDPSDRPTATVRGPAESIYLWLWGRADTDGLTVEGDTAVVDELRSIAASAT